MQRIRNFDTGGSHVGSFGRLLGMTEWGGLCDNQCNKPDFRPSALISKLQVVTSCQVCHLARDDTIIVTVLLTKADNLDLTLEVIRMKIEKYVKESFAVIGKEGSTLDGPGFIQRLWADANAHFGEVQPHSKDLKLEFDMDGI